MQTLTINTIPLKTSVFRILRLHADYACENSGRCCHNSWGITIARDRLEKIRAALTASGMTSDQLDQRIRPLPDSDNPLLAAKLIHGDNGACTFVEGAPGCTSCSMQRQIGHDEIPDICQAFPRLTVRTPAGVYLTLSYTCPTAAKLLLSDDGLHEVNPGRVFQFEPSLIGVSIADHQRAPVWVAGFHPEWPAFDYFWRWAVEFAARRDLTPAQSLFTLGLVVGAIEQNANRLVKLAPLSQLLEKVAAQPAADFLPICYANAPCTEIGLIYFDTLLKQIPSVPAPLQILWDAQTRTVPTRERFIGEYDARIRPRLADFERIERNFVASRLYAHPLAYRATRLRTGYFANVLSFVAFRFAMLALCLARDRPLDDAICLEAAGLSDDLLLHMQAMQTKFVQTLDTVVDTDIANLRRPALF